MEIQGIIYKITNKITNKSYIGLTTRLLEERVKEHFTDAFLPSADTYSTIFKKAIRKYGKENWEYEIIDTSRSIDELKEKEKYWIDYYHTYAFDNDSQGYNSTRGGDCPPEFLKRPVNSYDIVTGKLVKCYTSLSEAEIDLQVRIDNVGGFNRSSGGYAFQYAEDIIGYSEEEIIDRIHSLYPHLVYQLDLEGNFINLYRNTTIAANAIHSSQGNLIACCLGQRRLCKGYQFVYQKDIKERLGKSVRELSIQGVSVNQYALNGQFIQTWENILAAKIALNISDTHISQCCKGKRNLAGGFQWRYADEDITQLEPLNNKRRIICNETGEIFPTINHAVKAFNYAHGTIKKSCEGAKIKKPFTFRYEEFDEVQ